MWLALYPEPSTQGMTRTKPIAVAYVRSSKRSEAVMPTSLGHPVWNSPVRFRATVSPKSPLSLPTGQTFTLRASRWPSALRKQRQLCRRVSR